MIQKKAIYERYKEAFKDLPVKMNPYDTETMTPNFWLSCMLIDKSAMCKQVRSDNDYCYVSERGKSCPSEILDTLAKYNVQGRPLWKPMHMQPIYRTYEFVTREGDARARINAYGFSEVVDISSDIFQRGLCLPSDINMTIDEQNKIIQIIRSCFE